MKLLLDTHIALWATMGSSKLPRKAAALLADPSHEVWVSAIVPWEIGIKHAAGKMSFSGRQAIEAFKAAGFKMLALNEHHVSTLDALPTYDDHKDPFDRMMVAQAIQEEAWLVTADSKLDRFGPAICRV